ncbi:hypothetical protein Gogos_013195 [Gossypium gossypioides]|uniref:Uncharacterized protein n=1 Tax=Gossypium gossypioides TaxID=34282 RepID=A0A7J9BUU9_GOSGO|nr:hypothetical protein [Gossypium gossypioides]
MGKINQFSGRLHIIFVKWVCILMRYLTFLCPEQLIERLTLWRWKAGEERFVVAGLMECLNQ